MANEVYEARIAVTTAVNALLNAARAQDGKTIEDLRTNVNRLYKEKEALLASKMASPPPQTAEQLAEALMHAVFAPGAPTPHAGKKPESFGIFNPVNRHVVEVHVKEPAPVATDPANHGKTWREEDETKLVRLYRFGLSLSELANVFQRYEDAIVLRLHLLNHSHRTSAFVPENPNEAWYASKRKIFYGPDGRRNPNGPNGLTAFDNNSTVSFYSPHIVAGFDQPVRAV